MFEETIHKCRFYDVITSKIDGVSCGQHKPLGSFAKSFDESEPDKMSMQKKRHLANTFIELLPYINNVCTVIQTWCF